MAMTRPNLLAMQTLLTIGRLGTFTAAARQMNTTQSAVSARMRELERALGTALFQRRGRQLQLTVEARDLIGRIEPLVGAIEDLFAERESTAQPRGTIRIGLGEVSIEWFSRIVGRLHAEMPRLSFAIEIGMSAEVGEWLKDGRLDIGICANPQPDERLRYEPLGSDCLRWFCAPALLAGERRAVAELFRSELIWCVPRNSPFHAAARAELAAIGADLANLCTCTKLKGMLDIALGGGGIVLLPETMAAPHLAAGTLALAGEALEPHPLAFFLAIDAGQRQRTVTRVGEWLTEAAGATPL